MYVDPEHFIADAARVHETQQREAERARPFRFDGALISSAQEELVHRLRIWVEPETLRRATARQLEVGCAIDVASTTTGGRGYVREVDIGRSVLEMSIAGGPGPFIGGEPVRLVIRPLLHLVLSEADAVRRLTAKPELLRRLLAPKVPGPAPGAPRGSACPPVAAARLSPSQARVLAAALAAPELYVFCGPPGTGKTETLAWLVLGFLARGERVLLTSYQHRAIDECLERLAAIAAPHLASLVGGSPGGVARIGDPAKVAPVIHPWLGAKPGPGVRLVAATIPVALTQHLDELGLSTFDRVIVDEAGRTPLVSVLPVLARAQRSFILAGDPEQLRPICAPDSPKVEAAQSALEYYFQIDEVRELRSGVLTESFRFESEAVADGTRAFYEARGVDLAFPRLLADPGVDGAANHVLFLDTGVEEPRWRRHGGSFSLVQPVEAALVHEEAQRIAKEGLRLRDELLVLTPFRLQRELLRMLFRPKQRELVSSIDRAQGAERPSVIISLTVTTPEHVLKYLSPEKLNVAWSRARRRLILVGSWKALEEAYDARDAAGNPRMDGALRALVETIIERAVIRPASPSPETLEAVRRKLEGLCEPSGQGRGTSSGVSLPSKAPRQRAGGGEEESILADLRAIPRSARRLIVGLPRVRRRRM